MGSNNQGSGHRKALKIYSSEFILPLNKFGRMGTINNIFDGSFNIKIKDQLIHVGAYRGYVSGFGSYIDRSDYLNILTYVDIGNRVRVTESSLTFYSGRGIETFDYQVLPIDLKVRTVPEHAWLVGQIQLAYDEAVRDGLRIGLRTEAPAFREVSEIIRRQRVTEAQWNQVIKYMVGRGRGLTPSGDDMLVGYLTVLLMFAPARAQMLSNLLHVRKLSTTDVSLAYLLASSQGYVSSPLHEFYQVVEKVSLGQLLGEEAHKALVKAIQRVMRIGHTSGKDMTYGIGLGLAYVRENEVE